MTQTVLLTGVSGYIAKHIALQLLEAGYHVRGTLRQLSRATEVRDALRTHLTDPRWLEDRLSFVALDLTSDTGWDAAMAGVDVLMHTASPFPLSPPKNPDDLIRPAVDGALRALGAAQRASVARVVLTSSTAAISGSALPAEDTSFDETNWTNPDDPEISAYTRSKTLAEQAAWNFIGDHAATMQLTVINPGLVLGAPLDAKFGSSVKIIARILRAKDPMLPNIGFPCVDVSDVAEMHVAVIADPKTYGQRIMTVDKFMTFADLAQAIKAAYPTRKITARVAPDPLVRLGGVFDPAAKSIVPALGRVDRQDNTRARQTLGRGLRQAHTLAVATATYLIEHKLG